MKAHRRATEIARRVAISRDLEHHRKTRTREYIVNVAILRELQNEQLKAERNARRRRKA